MLQYAVKRTLWMFPTFFLIIAVTAFLEPSIINIMVALGLVGWTNVFRLVRGEVLKTRGLEYVTAARALDADELVMYRFSRVGSEVNSGWSQATQ